MKNHISKELIAPCGMNCAVCSRYLSYANNLKKSKCSGCRPRQEKCTYLYGKCAGINNNKITKNAKYCIECDKYPCKQIDRIDKRYKTNYKMSMKENLENIKKNGINTFVKEQYEKYKCSDCGSLISIHNNRCFKCNKIEKLIIKQK
jgi:hypothetical protein